MFVPTVVRALLLIAACLLPLAGCGGGHPLETYEVEAQVLLDDKPFGPTAISLVPMNTSDEVETRTVAGQVDADGKVTFTTFERGDGVPAGEYRVVIGLVMAPPPAPFPALYRDYEKSPLTVTVEPQDGTQLAIKMDSKAGPAATMDSEMVKKVGAASSAVGLATESKDSDE